MLRLAPGLLAWAIFVASLCACDEPTADEAPTFSVHDGGAAKSDSTPTDSGGPSDTLTTNDDVQASDGGDGWDADGPCQGDEMCPPERFCLNGSCLPDICVPKSAKCSNLAAKAVCMDSGAGYISEDCKEKESCEDGECKSAMCDPGKKFCVDNQVVVCGARGVSWKDAIDCGDKATCIEAVCIPTVCDKGEAKCAGDTLMTCNDDGTGWLKQPCKSGQSCDGAADTPKCVKQVCTPGAGFCDGDTARQCGDNGLTSTEVGDCSKPSSDGKKQKCLGGKCVPYGCVPGDKICQEGMVGTCVAGGSGYSLEICKKNQVCDAGECKLQICVVGEHLCDGNLVKACIEGGTALAVIGKCGADQACVGSKGKAECVQQICKPGNKTCNKAGTGIDVCKPDGLGTSGYDCPVGQVCDKAACVKQLCDPSSLYCSVDWVMKCNIVGSGADKVSQCKPDEICTGGKCAAKLCKPGQATCKNINTLSVCDDPAKGLQDKPCADKHVCSSGKCVQQVCPPSTKYCEGTQVMLCDKSGLSKLMNLDCAFQKKTCAKGECVSPQCGNGKTEPGEECDDGNNKAGDGCSPKCVKEIPQQCKPGAACCTADGKWLGKGSKCGKIALLKKHSCSGKGKGASRLVSSGYSSCKGNSSNCDYLKLWWSQPTVVQKCSNKQVCKVAPANTYSWCDPP